MSLIFSQFEWWMIYLGTSSPSEQCSQAQNGHSGKNFSASRQPFTKCLCFVKKGAITNGEDWCLNYLQSVCRQQSYISYWSDMSHIYWSFGTILSSFWLLAVKKAYVFCSMLSEEDHNLNWNFSPSLRQRAGISKLVKCLCSLGLYTTAHASYWNKPRTYMSYGYSAQIEADDEKKRGRFALDS